MKIAVAFIYQEIPRYDRMEFDGDSYRFYRGTSEVSRIFITEAGVFHPRSQLDVWVTDAESEKDAITMLAAQHPYDIVSAIARRI